MEEDYQRDLEPSFTNGYGCCVFKHEIYGGPDCMPNGDQPEVSNCMPDSPNFLSLECFASLRCPLPRHPLKMQLSRCIVEKWQRNLIEVLPSGI